MNNTHTHTGPRGIVWAAYGSTPVPFAPRAHLYLTRGGHG
jgi:hypothetical protein